MSTSDDAFELGRVVHRPLPAGCEDVAGMDAGQLLAGLRAAMVEANRVEARKHAMLSQLYSVRDDARRVREASSRKFVREWDELVAEAGAVLQTGRGAAGAVIHRSLDLRERLPLVFALSVAGRIGSAQVRAALATAACILDEQVLAEYDARIATWLTVMTADADVAVTGPAVTEAARAILVRIDRDAMPEVPAKKPRFGVEMNLRRDGAVDLEAVMPTAGGIKYAALLAEAAKTTCRKDPRTVGEKMVEAMVALAEGFESIGCLCEGDGCEFKERRPRTGAVAPGTKAIAVIVLNESDFRTNPSPARTSDAAGGASAADQEKADADAGDGDVEPVVEPEPAEPEPEPDVEADVDPEAAESAPAESHSPGGAIVLSGERGISGPVTAEQANEMIEACDTAIRVLGSGDPDTGEVHLAGASGYTPTQYQLLVMRLTYPTCVFPGCGVPSARCQADHVGEYDHRHPERGGQTTVAGKNGPGNLVPLCGFHHRIKTETGWLSDLLDDGTVEWRHPAGGIWLVPPGTARELLPGLGKLVWDSAARTPVVNTQAGQQGEDFDDHARRRAQARRTQRAANRRLRARRKEEARKYEEELQREEAERQGREYVPGTPPEPPPF